MKQAVILAAGEGRRLRPFTVNKPKAMLSIAGKPTLQYTIEALAHNGIRDLVLVVGYRREHIFDCMGSGEQFGVKIIYINQEKQLGTADALLQVESVVDDKFVVCLIPYKNNINKDEIISYSIDFLGEFLKCNFNDIILNTYYENWDKGIPIVDEKYVKAVNKLNIMNFDNLLFAGDYTTLSPSMESAVKSGMETVKEIERFKS